MTLGRASRKFELRPLIALLALWLFAACEGESQLVVLVEMDESIAHGLHGGDHEGHGHEHSSAIVDGWELEFSYYIVHFGDVTIAKSADLSSAQELAINTFVDLKRIGASEELGVLNHLSSGRWDRLSWSVSPPDDSSECHPRVPHEICEAMKRDGASVYLAGSLTKPGGRSCPPTEEEGRDAEQIDFEFALPIAVRFAECQSAGGEGVGLPSGGTSAIALSYHAEHLLFNAFAEGQREIRLRAQYLANADLDGDGVVSLAELRAVKRQDFDELFTRCSDDVALSSFSDGYSLSGAINEPIETLEDYLIAHLMTQGHVDGEHECAAVALER